MQSGCGWCLEHHPQRGQSLRVAPCPTYVKSATREQRHCCPVHGRVPTAGHVGRGLAAPWPRMLILLPGLWVLVVLQVFDGLLDVSAGGLQVEAAEPDARAVSS